MYSHWPGAKLFIQRSLSSLSWTCLSVAQNGGGCCLSTVYNFWLSEVQDELSINRFRTKSFGSRQNSKNMQEQPFVSHPRRKNILHHLEPQYKPSPRGCRTYWLNGSVNCVHLCIVSIPLPVTVFFWLGCRFFSKVIPTYTDCCR